MKATSKDKPTESENAAATGRKSFFTRPTIVWIVLGALLVAALSGSAGGYFFIQDRKNDQQTQTKQGSLSDVSYVVSRVSRHMILPSDETPALLTVTDTTKLTSTFLRQAKNGDKVLVYQANKKAVIYRPSADKIVDVGPVVIDDVQKS